MPERSGFSLLRRKSEHFPLSLQCIFVINVSSLRLKGG